MTGIISDNVGRTSGLIKAAAGGGGVWTLIKTLTASASATLSFVNGTAYVVLDSTYPIYVFKFINCHPATDNTSLMFNMSTDSGSNYNVTKTTTFFNALHTENDATAYAAYQTGVDLAQSTSNAYLMAGIGNNNDDNGNGELFLFNPSSTTFVKHFIFTSARNAAVAVNDFVSGYGNTTSAINAVQFSMASGNIDAGKIKLYGLKDSA